MNNYEHQQQQQMIIQILAPTLLFYITKYNFKAAVWYLHQSYLNYIHWNLKVTVSGLTR